MKNILVTGSEGYIGQVLVRQLLEEGYRVTGIDTDYYYDGYFSSPPSGYNLILKDIRSVEQEDFKGIDAVIHLAALSNDPIGELNPALAEDINFNATVSLAKLSKIAGVQRFIFSSSCSLYGMLRDREVSEDDQLNPLTAYAKSKVNSEKALSLLADQNFTPVYMRNATVYGASPKLRLDLVINNLIGWALSNKTISVSSDGTPWRPLIHVEDLSRAFIIMLKPRKEKIFNQSFNIGTPDNNFQIKTLAYKIKEQLSDCSVEILNENGSDARSYLVNFSKFLQTFPDFSASWTLEDGIENIIKQYRSNGLTEMSRFESRQYTRIRQIKWLLSNHLVNTNLFWV